MVAVAAGAIAGPPVRWGMEPSVAGVIAANPLSSVKRVRLMPAASGYAP
jgi:hypothetical protein